MANKTFLLEHRGCHAVNFTSQSPYLAWHRATRSKMHCHCHLNFTNHFFHSRKLASSHRATRKELRFQMSKSSSAKTLQRVYSSIMNRLKQEVELETSEISEPDEPG